MRMGVAETGAAGEGMVELYAALQPLLDEAAEQRIQAEGDGGQETVKLAIIGIPNVVCLWVFWAQEYAYLNYVQLHTSTACEQLDVEYSVECSQYNHRPFMRMRREVHVMYSS